MSTLNFPSSPTNGQVYENYTYNASKGVWELTAFLTLPNFLIETGEKTTNYTLSLNDISSVVLMNGTNLVVTVPTNAAVAFPLGTIINVYNANSTDVTIVGDSGVIVRNAGDLREFGEVSLRKRGTDEWVLAGDVS